MSYESYLSENENLIKNQIENLNLCEHIKTEIRSRGMHYGNQCTRCGEWVGGWIKHNEISDSEKEFIKPFDETIRENYNSTRSDLYVELSKIRDEKCCAEIEKKREWYREYLKSPEWKGKRLKVLARCGYLCEGCGIYKASQVHHLTYNNVGNEFLFELVGLCSKCHSEIHDKDGE